MTPDEYEQLCRLFLDACELGEEERAALLAKELGDRPQMRHEVERMLARDRDSGLATGAAAEACREVSPTLAAGPETAGGTRSLGDRAVVAGYQLLEELGRGGMGVVFKALQQTPRRVVALKMIRAGRFASPADVQRFRAEAQAAAGLDHVGIVPIYEAGEFQGEPYFSMQLVEGENLEAVLRRGSCSAAESLEILRQVCRAVAHAHDRGIVHRDLKPSNILLDSAGRPRVTDFGLAKYLHGDSALTAHGDVMGTPGYMAPEQATGEADRVTPAADVYSLGAILYQLLTDRTPILAQRGNLIETLRRIEEHDVVPPRALERRVPRDLNTICIKALAKDPAQRYATAGDFADDLDRFVEGEAILARPPGLASRLLRWARHRPGLAATWFAVGFFYLYHLICFYVFRIPDITAPFHALSTFVAASFCLSAWWFQRMLIRSAGRARYLFLWVTADVALTTLLLFGARGPQSPLAMLYHVLVAGSVLRFRTDLVGYVTALSVSGYLLHVAVAAASRPEDMPTLLEAAPFVLSLVIIGVIQYFALRRSRASYELAARHLQR